MGLGLVLTYAENQTISTSSGVAWVDDEDVRTAWTEPTDDSTTRTYTLQAGNPMGLLLGITYADTVTVTETSGVAWTELDQTITSWTEE
ncbi:MAG: hypothetical protein DRP09_10930 [Candidatus Thorarchaeota archaeon]|nr:MAG: hypothetical protein DRP09_10930 [Candidatus Thorarchaeota archaeon]